MKVAIEVIGWIGALLILLAYALMATRRVVPTAASYQWMNLAGSAGLIVNGAWNGAIPVAFLNIVWLGITLYSLAKARASA